MSFRSQITHTQALNEERILKVAKDQINFYQSSPPQVSKADYISGFGSPIITDFQISLEETKFKD